MLPVVEKDPESRRSEMIKVILFFFPLSLSFYFFLKGRGKEAKGVCQIKKPATKSKEEVSTQRTDCVLPRARYTYGRR